MRCVSLCCLAIVLVPVSLSAQSLSDPNLQVEVVPASGLALPTAMKLAPNGDIFVTEKNTGKVKVVSGGVATEVLDLSVANNSERGLLGLELHPDFGNNGLVYLYYSLSATPDDGTSWAENRVSRFTYTGAALTNEQTLFSIPSDPNQANGPNHNGGTLLFGPDGKLYGATGDLNRDRAEQNNPALPATSADSGGIFRLNEDGSIPSDNPFLGEANPDFHPWFAYGVRNSFGLAFDPITGQLWDTENGPNVYDEINLVEAGFNSGWNSVMGPADTGSPPTLVVLDDSFYSDPEFSFLSPIGITAIEFLDGSSLSDYTNGVVVGDVNTRSIYFLSLNSSRDGFDLTGDLSDLVADSAEERNQLIFGEEFGIVTDFEVGPDGALYVSSLTNSSIYRISVVPEVSSLGLLALGTGILALFQLNRRKRHGGDAGSPRA